ncbi:MAG: hypothetical protein CMF59_18460 [Leptospiraceae bacterium]|nr:hypothetical protein [Leptospiraceae bacterium]
MNQMEGSRNRYVAIAVAAILLGILTYRTAHSFYVWESRYQTECVNKDLLNWDGNLRFTSVLEFNRDFREGKPGDPLLELLKSPTWPPLRKAISLGLSFFSSEPNPVVDTHISTAFSLLLLLALPFCGWVILRKEEGLWAGAVAGLIVLTMSEFPIYSFAAMLETQGMLFFLIACTAYYLNRDAGFASGRGQKHVRWILFIGFFGLYMTKYPYGILLILSVLLIESVSYSRRLVNLVKDSIWPHYWFRWSLIFPVLVGAAIFVFLFRTQIGLPAEGKVYKQALYATLLLTFLDLNVHWFRTRLQVRKILLAHQLRMYAWGILPVAIWFLSSPDRFGAFLGAGLHVQEQGRVFAWSLLVDTLELSALMPLVIALLAAGMMVISRGQRNLRTWVRDPMNAVVLVILGNLLLLEVLTANKQLRHIYHLVPALVLFSFLVLFKRYRPGHSRPGIISARGAVGEAAGLLACVLIGGLFVFFPGSMGAAPEEDYICFSGTDRAPAEPARRVASQVPEDSKIVVWNRFHELDSPPPGRSLASEIDLLIRYRTGARARNESAYSLQSWQGFDRFAYISYDCKSEVLKSVQNHVEKNRGVELAEGSIYFDQSGICMQLYRIKK